MNPSVPAVPWSMRPAIIGPTARPKSRANHAPRPTSASAQASRIGSSRWNSDIRYLLTRRTPTTSGASRSARRRARAARSRRCAELAALSCAIASAAERLPSDRRKTRMSSNLAMFGAFPLARDERHARATAVVAREGEGAATRPGDDARLLGLVERLREATRPPATGVDLPLELVALRRPVVAQRQLQRRDLVA